MIGPDLTVRHEILETDVDLTLSFVNHPTLADVGAHNVEFGIRDGLKKDATATIKGRLTARLTKNYDATIAGRSAKSSSGEHSHRNYRGPGRHPALPLRCNGWGQLHCRRGNGDTI